MRRLTFSDAVRSSLREIVDNAPRQHSLRTADCPRLTRFPAALAKGWKRHEAAHIRACPYCQKMIVIQWRIEPPSLGLLARYAAGFLPELQDAMETYLAERPSAIVIVSAISRLAEMAKPPSPHLGDWAPAVGFAPNLGRTSLNQGPISLNLGPTSPTDTSRTLESGRFHYTWSSNDDALQCSLEETAEGALRLVVYEPKGKYVDQIMRFGLVFATGEPLAADVVMSELKPNGAVGQHTFGRFAELAPRMARGLTVVVTPK